MRFTLHCPRNRFRFFRSTRWILRKLLWREPDSPILHGIRNGESDGVRLRVIAPFMRDFVADADFFGNGRDTDESELCGVPPGLIRTLLNIAGETDGAGRDLAGIVDSQDLALLVGKGVPVIFVKRAAARVDCG